MCTLQAVYDRMFTSVVQCINKAIEVKRQSVVVTGHQTVIGVLDIYGFEIFDNNRCVEFQLSMWHELRTSCVTRQSCIAHFAPTPLHEGLLYRKYITYNNADRRQSNRGHNQREHTVGLNLDVFPEISSWTDRKKHSDRLFSESSDVLIMFWIGQLHYVLHLCTVHIFSKKWKFVESTIQKRNMLYKSNVNA